MEGRLTRETTWLMLIALLSCGVSCGRSWGEEAPSKSSPVPNSLAGKSLACGMFPTALIAETTNLPLDQIYHFFPNSVNGGNGAESDDSIPGDCHLSYRRERIPRLQFRYSYLTGDPFPRWPDEQNDYNLVVKNPERVPLPAGLGKGFFAEGYGSYMTYPCGKIGPIYVQLMFSDKSAKTTLADALPLLRIMHEEVKKSSSCV